MLAERGHPPNDVCDPAFQRRGQAFVAEPLPVSCPAGAAVPAAVPGVPSAAVASLRVPVQKTGLPVARLPVPAGPAQRLAFRESLPDLLPPVLDLRRPDHGSAPPAALSPATRVMPAVSELGSHFSTTG